LESFDPNTPVLSRITTAFIGFAALLFSAQNTFAQNADFSASPGEGCFPLTVIFDPVLKVPGTTYKWDFGNNNTSTDQNPSAIYASPGNYDVTLTVNNTATVIHGSFVIVHDAPAVDFSFDKASGCAPLTVKFKDQTSTASGNIDSWSWVFGDGGTSSQANPTYTFVTPGNPIVSLRVRNQFGCEKLKSITSPIAVLGPIAKFTVDKTAVCALPAAFQFTNQSTGNNNTYLWTFGDGQTSTDINPSHSYSQAGTFEVVMKAKDAGGCEQSFKLKVNAGTEGGIDMDLSTDKVCFEKPIDFDVLFAASNPPTSVSWNFGDGNSSLINDPSHTYDDPGTYTVTLDVKLLNNNCNSIVTKEVLVAKPAVPSFTFTSDCNYKVVLTSTSQNSSIADWYVGDVGPISGRSIVSPVAAPGNQDIRLVAFDAAGCSAEKEQTIFVTPSPFAAFEPNVFQSCDNTKPQLAGCAPFTVNFKNTSTSDDPATTIKWEFGDNTESTAQTPVHVFQKGLFQVTLTATDSRGCKGTSTQFVQVADQPPVADFTVDITTACSGKDLIFTNTSTNSDFWCWDFGDGSIESTKNPVHKYNRPGVYTVKLTARNAGCIDVEVKTNLITIKDPEIQFNWDKRCNDPHKVLLVDRSKNYDAGTLHWNFGDGHISDRPDTVTGYKYQNEGIYHLELTGSKASTGCVVTAYIDIVIQDVKADFEVNTDHPCANTPIAFKDKSAKAIKWEWTLADQSFAVPDPTTKLKIPGNYTANLKVFDSDGCFKTASKPITVVDLKGNFGFTASSTCDELNVQIVNGSTNPDPVTYTWDFGDGTMPVTSFAPTHPYTALGEYTVKLTVTTPAATCEFSNENAIVFTNPEPGFQTSKQEFCPGDVVQVANTTKNAVLYEWDYGDGRRADFKSPQIPYSNTGKYTISLFATDSYGCERKLVKDEFIIIEKPTADFSIENASSACPPFTAKFHDESNPVLKEWQWDFGDGQNSILEDPTNIYLKPGKFNVSLTVTDDKGCKDTKTSQQFVSIDGPTGSFVFDGPAECTNKTISYNADVDKTVKFRWDFGDGTVQESTTANVFHTYKVPGTFAPVLILVDRNGCENRADGTDFLQIRDTTAVTMTISPSCIRAGEPFKLQGSSENNDDITNWTWTIDGIELGSGNDYQAALDKPGSAVVTGYALNKFNCISHATETVRVQGELTIPNVITPDGDLNNESFRIPGLENSTWNLEVMNRWGTNVFQKIDYKGDWNGNDQPAGVYYFILRNTVCKEEDYKGFISIVR
jgi:PKD repeat protein